MIYKKRVIIGMRKINHKRHKRLCLLLLKKSVYLLRIWNAESFPPVEKTFLARLRLELYAEHLNKIRYEEQG
jgi:hypothetical protein